MIAAAITIFGAIFVAVATVKETDSVLIASIAAAVSGASLGVLTGWALDGFSEIFWANGARKNFITGLILGGLSGGGLASHEKERDGDD